MRHRTKDNKDITLDQNLTTTSIVKEKKSGGGDSATSSTNSMTRKNLVSNYLLSNSNNELDPKNEANPNVIYLKKLLKKLNIAIGVSALVSKNENISTTNDPTDKKPEENTEDNYDVSI